MNNQDIAQLLSDHAAALNREPSNLYRVRAYRWAAETVRSLARPMTEILEQEGRAGIAALPGVGAHLSYTITELIRTGEFKTWQDRPRGMRLSAAAR